LSLPVTSAGSVRPLPFETEICFESQFVLTRTPQLVRPLVHRLGDGANAAVRQLARQLFGL